MEENDILPSHITYYIGENIVHVMCASTEQIDYLIIIFFYSVATHAYSASRPRMPIMLLVL